TTGTKLERRIGTPPGAHGRKGGNRKVSDYGVQLAEKQKAKIIYGILERQFKKYYTEAARNPLSTGDIMLQLLERRLDNCIYRLGFVPTRAAARQIVSHGNVTVNGKKLNIPSYKVRVGDVVSLSDTAANIPYVKSLLADKEKLSAAWLDKKATSGKVSRLPSRSDITEAINEQLIVEFYSR
ncbi:MAG: 30S ribosomal protein S4, partial [Microgenomates group bacterium]